MFHIYYNSFFLSFISGTACVVELSYPVHCWHFTFFFIRVNLQCCCCWTPRTYLLYNRRLKLETETGKTMKRSGGEPQSFLVSGVVLVRVTSGWNFRGVRIHAYKKIRVGQICYLTTWVIKLKIQFTRCPINSNTSWVRGPCSFAFPRYSQAPRYIILLVVIVDYNCKIVCSSTRLASFREVQLNEGSLGFVERKLIVGMNGRGDGEKSCQVGVTVDAAGWTRETEVWKKFTQKTHIIYSTGLYSRGVGQQGSCTGCKIGELKENGGFSWKWVITRVRKKWQP